MSTDRLAHRGYRGAITERTTCPDGDALLVWRGRVLGIRDVVTFVGEGTVDEIEMATEREFRASVDDYLEMCKGRGKKPNAPESFPV